MTDPTCPDCGSPDVGTEQTQLPFSVAESYLCEDCGTGWPVGTWQDGRLR